MSVFGKKDKARWAEMNSPKPSTGSIFSRNLDKARGAADDSEVKLTGAFVPSTPEDIARYARLAKKRDTERRKDAEAEVARYKIELDRILPKSIRDKPLKEKALRQVFIDCVEERRLAYKQDKKKDPRWAPTMPAYEGWESTERADSNFVFAMQSFISGFSWNQLTRLINTAVGQEFQTKDWSEAFHIFENIMDIVMKIELDSDAVRYILTDRKNFLKSWDIRIVERGNQKRKATMTNDDEDVKRKLRAARHDDDEDEDDIEDEEDDTDEDDEDDEPAPKKVAKKRKVVDEDDDDVDDEDGGDDDSDDGDDDDDDEEKPEPKKVVKKKSRKVVDEDEDEPAPRKKSSKSRRAVVEDDSDEDDDAEDDNDAEDSDDEPTPKRKKTVAAKKKVTKAAAPAKVAPKKTAKPKPAKLATDSVLKKTSTPYEPGNGVKGTVYGLIKRKGTAYTALLAATKEEGVNQATTKKLVLLFIKKGYVKIAVDEPEA